MAKSLRGRRLTSLRSLLLLWICGSGIILVLVYTGLIEYYFRFGIILKTKVSFENSAITFAEEYSTNPYAPLPTGPRLKSYRTLEEIPDELLTLFPQSSHEHGEIEQTFLDDQDDDATREQLKSLCDGALCKLVFFYAYQIDDTNWLYMMQGIVPTEQARKEADISENIAEFIALIIMSLFAALAFLLIRSIEKPVHSLATWADRLTPEQLGEIPDFQYRELNLVANRLGGAFERISESLEKEHRFLQHASHELRTPIAVASGNLELLEKMASRETRSQAECQAFDRLKYAIKDMQQLTETLLWLNRDSESPPSNARVDLNGLINDLITSNKYLLKYKAVEVNVVGPPVVLNAPATLCRIVLANLVRNAFQYTEAGVVLVKISKDSVTIHNENVSDLSQEVCDVDNDYGFGLGLSLVEQITQRLGWLYAHETQACGRSSTIIFHSPK